MASPVRLRCPTALGIRPHLATSRLMTSPAVPRHRTAVLYLEPRAREASRRRAEGPMTGAERPVPDPRTPRTRPAGTRVAMRMGRTSRSRRVVDHHEHDLVGHRQGHRERGRVCVPGSIGQALAGHREHVRTHRCRHRRVDRAARPEARGDPNEAVAAATASLPRKCRSEARSPI
jgi:hypothetical protein